MSAEKEKGTQPNAEQTTTPPAATPAPPAPKKVPAPRELTPEEAKAKVAAEDAAVKEAARQKAYDEWVEKNGQQSYEHSPLTGVNTPAFWGDQPDGYNYAAVPLYKVESRGGRTPTTENKQRYINRGYEVAPDEHPGWQTIDRGELILMRKPAMASEMAHAAAVAQMQRTMEGAIEGETGDMGGQDQKGSVSQTKKSFRDVIEDLPEQAAPTPLTDEEVKLLLEDQ